MQSQHSNYDSDGFVTGSTNKLGGLNPNQEFRPQPQKITSGAGLLVSVSTDVPGKISIDFTNIIEEPYAFTTEYNIQQSDIKDVTINNIVITEGTKTYLLSITAQYFRVRFRNTSNQKQNRLKLFTFILPSSPVVSINPDTLQDVFLKTGLYDASGNSINTIIPTTDTNRALCVHNINDYTTNRFIFATSLNILVSNSIQLKKYKSFDINFEDIIAMNLLPIRFYLYTSKDNISYSKSNYYVDIYYGMSNTCITNIIIDADYIKLKSIIVSNLNSITINSCYVTMKG